MSSIFYTKRIVIFALFFFISLLFTKKSFSESRRLYTPLDNFIELPTIEIGGFIHSKGGHSIKRNKVYNKKLLPDYDYSNSGDARISWGTSNAAENPAFTNDAEVYIKASGTSDFGTKYGAIFQLEASTASSFVNQLNASRAYFLMESMSGKIELGDNIGANQQMKVGPANFARSAGGINGKYLQHVNFPMMRSSEDNVDTSGDFIDDNGSCPGYAIYSPNFETSFGQEKYSPFRDECGFYKLPSFIVIPQAPVSHGGYARGFYNSNLTHDHNEQNYFAAYAGDYSYNRQRDDLTLRDGSFGQMENATKLTYYTPRVNGWQIGTSYAPDTGNKGSYLTGSSNGDLKNVIGWGLNYADNIENLGIALSITGEHGEAEEIDVANWDFYDDDFTEASGNNTIRNNLESYEAGIVLNYFGFSLGGSYGLWGDSLNPKSGPYSCDYGESVTINHDDSGYQVADGSNGNVDYWNFCDTYGKKFKKSYYMTAGVGYEFGPFASSLTAIKSRFQMNKYEAASLGVDYKISKGVLFYVEGTYFKFESNQANFNIGDNVNGGNQSLLSNDDRLIIDNKGRVVLAGFLFSF
jgi:hypothetical protein